MLGRLFRRKPIAVSNVVQPKFSLMERVTGKAAKTLAASDMKYLENLAACISFYNAPILDASDPLYQSADGLLLNLKNSNNSDFRQAIDAIENHLDEKIASFSEQITDVKPESWGDVPDTSFTSARAHYRLLFLKHYCTHLLRAQDEGELAQLDASVVNRVVEVSLKGTSPDRVTVILTCTQHITGIATLPAEHKKRFAKFAKVYLLDKFELNAKSRCLFAWTDPKYSGFNHLSDDMVMPMEKLIENRTEHFPESDAVHDKLMEAYIAERREFHHTKDENRETMHMGVAFLFGVCICDYIVGIL